MESETLIKAQELWAYMSSFDEKRQSDAVVVCCSYDLRVCDHACDLIKSGLSDILLLSGNTGNWTKHIWTKPEALVFEERAKLNGLSESQIVLECSATNFGENIRYARELLPSVNTVTFVSKPSALLRVMLTAAAQWPEVTSYVTCPKISFPEEVSNVVGVLGVIDEMVGDIQRVQDYPALGFQVAHELPSEVLVAWEYLIGQGFTNHLTPNEHIEQARAKRAPLL
ncbi:MAG: YdcF family protein [Pseudomonadota bacterium]